MKSFKPRQVEILQMVSLWLFSFAFGIIFTLSLQLIFPPLPSTSSTPSSEVPSSSEPAPLQTFAEEGEFVPYRDVQGVIMDYELQDSTTINRFHEYFEEEYGFLNGERRYFIQYIFNYDDGFIVFVEVRAITDNDHYYRYIDVYHMNEVADVLWSYSFFVSGNYVDVVDEAVGENGFEIQSIAFVNDSGFLFSSLFVYQITSNDQTYILDEAFGWLEPFATDATMHTGVFYFDLETEHISALKVIPIMDEDQVFVANIHISDTFMSFSTTYAVDDYPAYGFEEPDVLLEGDLLAVDIYEVHEGNDSTRFSFSHQITAHATYNGFSFLSTIRYGDAQRRDASSLLLMNFQWYQSAFWSQPEDEQRVEITGLDDLYPPFFNEIYTYLDFSNASPNAEFRSAEVFILYDMSTQTVLHTSLGGRTYFSDDLFVDEVVSYTILPSNERFYVEEQRIESLYDYDDEANESIITILSASTIGNLYDMDGEFLEPITLPDSIEVNAWTVHWLEDDTYLIIGDASMLPPVYPTRQEKPFLFALLIQDGEILATFTYAHATEGLYLIGAFVVENALYIYLLTDAKTDDFANLDAFTIFSSQEYVYRIGLE